MGVVSVRVVMEKKNTKIHQYQLEEVLLLCKWLHYLVLLTILQVMLEHKFKKEYEREEKEVNRWIQEDLKDQAWIKLQRKIMIQGFLMMFRIILPLIEHNILLKISKSQELKFFHKLLERYLLKEVLTKSNFKDFSNCKQKKE